jgi:hypothetical protein
VPQIRFITNRKLALKCPQCAPEEFKIICDLSVITSEMDIHRSAGELGINPAEWAHIVGTHQNVRYAKPVFKVLELVELILLRTSPSGFGQMLRFVYDDDFNLAILEGIFHYFA